MEVRSVTVDAQVLGEAIRGALAQGGGFVLTVTGNSMRPTLVPGRDQVCLMAPKTVKPGDIIFFCRGQGEYVLHRVLSEREGVFTVNGDSQVWMERVPRSHVIGVAVRIRRKGTWYNMDSPLMKAYGALWPATRRLRPALIRMKGKLKK